MAERSIFELKFDLSAADKAAREQESRRAGSGQGQAGQTSQAGTGAPGAAPLSQQVLKRLKEEIKKEIEREQREPESALEEATERREDEEDLARERAPLRLDRAAIAGTIAALLATIPGVGELGRLFVQEDPGKLQFLASLLGLDDGLIGGAIDAVVGSAQSVRAELQGGLGAVADVTNIGKAFGAIGAAPPASIIPATANALYIANAAQASFQQDITESVFKSAGSSSRQFMDEIIGLTGIEKLKENLLGGLLQ